MEPPRETSRGGRIVEHSVKRAVATRRIFPYLVAITAGLGLLAGFLVTLVDKADFPTFGTGVWWAIVTLGTVGYGDVVPHTTWGRVIGGVVIVVGVTFLSFLIAIVTSYFVSGDQEKQAARDREERAGELATVLESLGRIERRLETLERRPGN
jgi:voltage-gated potassium channel